MIFDFRNKKVLITAGPTYEPIDPVRFIGNRSSGKMGYAIANELAARGAEVFLVSGPVNLTLNHPNIQIIKVETAEEMFHSCLNNFSYVDIAILAAAVADYTPVFVSNSKIKKQNDTLLLELKKTKDILASLGKIKQKNQLLVGFSLETENEIENSKNKLLSKNCDFIIINSLQHKDAGFTYDTNKISILDRLGNIIEFPLKNKSEVAADICDYVVRFTDLILLDSQF